MRVHHSLWESGGSAGIVDREQSVLFGFSHPRVRRAAAREQALVIVDDVLKASQVPSNGIKEWEEVWVGDQSLGIAMIQNPRKLRRVRTNIQHYQHCPDCRDCEMRLQSRRCIAG